ncbi:MAG: cytochrome C oxidase subunit IV family protein, partial [Anaerolineales bacterium]|nr:cytochrome C oxidase subunit IV family protein [Anaerolineales bacterium]
ASRARQYLLVFAALAVITAIEIAMTQTSIAASLANALFLAFSLAKATLVAAFFMHLRDDSRIYTAIFLLPVVLVLAFSTLMLMSAGGH